MRKVLVLGAGKSSYHLINYFIENAQQQNWFVTVGDFSIQTAEEKVKNRLHAKPITFDINDSSNSQSAIADADIVISLLPPSLHHLVAVECVKLKKNLVTASYVSTQMQQLHDEVKKSGLIFLNECGLDPGIDHMSAMQIIDDLKTRGAQLLSFKSYTGGLVAPECNDNPWGYKFSWNPRNVILAGQGVARYIQNGNFKFIPYHNLFAEAQKVEIDDAGSFEGYANRDSISYRHIYKIDSIPTLLRGTLRCTGFCSAWDVFVKLGLTDDTFKIENCESLSYEQFITSFIPNATGNAEGDLKKYFTGKKNIEKDLELIQWTGILSKEKIGLSSATPAQILQHLLENKWVLKPTDLDMIVMQHIFEYSINQKNYTLKSSLVCKGENNIATAMSKTVGLPLAIAAKNILNKKINAKGVHIPVENEMYEPVLSELKEAGIYFTEKVI